MKKICFVALFSWGTLFAQTLPADETVLRFANTITARDLRAHIGFLADDLMEGRETGQRGQQLAANYVRAQFMRLGLLPGNEGSYFQPYILEDGTFRQATMTTGSKKWTYRTDFFNISGLLPAALEGAPVFGGYARSENLQNLNVRDKIIVALADDQAGGSLYDQVSAWEERAAIAEAAGARALVYILPDDEFSTLSRFAPSRFTRVTGAEAPRQFPVIYLSPAMGTYLMDKAKTSLADQVSFLATNPVPQPLNWTKLPFALVSDFEVERLPAANVLGVLEGTDKKDEYLIITGHYDHIGIVNGQINNGADDDASGTSTVLELAEAFAQAAEAGFRPRRTIVFMTVSGEEKGLLGSEFYTENPVFPLSQTVCNLNIDMVGRIGDEYMDSPDSTNYIYLIGADKLSSELHTLSESANDRYTRLRLDYKYNDERDPNRFYYRSDHYNFAKNGIPIIFYFNGVHPDYHRPTDDIEKIQYEKAALVGKLVFTTAWEVANRDNRLVVDKAAK
ncbi:MAG: M28 family peptidase [Bacteroidia bacterium]|nr:M28 family peptidase [Bacteroidia bacterium]